MSAPPPPMNPAALAAHEAEADRRQRIDALCKKHELRPQIAQDLIRIISPVRVVMIVDDSSSMVQEEIPEGITNPFAARPVTITRWSEAVQNTALVCEYVFAICHQPVDVYFLNRPKVMGAKCNADLAAAFAAPPNGNTPLTDAFNTVMRDYAWTLPQQQPLLVLIFTDGEPTTVDGWHSDLGGFKNALMAKPPNVHVCVVECTDDEASMDYIDSWKGHIPQFDGIDHFITECNRVRTAQGANFSFSRSDYVALILLGAFLRNYFVVDQWKVNLGNAPANLASVSALGNIQPMMFAGAGGGGGGVGVVYAQQQQQQPYMYAQPQQQQPYVTYAQQAPPMYGQQPPPQYGMYGQGGVVYPQVPTGVVYAQQPQQQGVMYAPPPPYAPVQQYPY